MFILKGQSTLFFAGSQGGKATLGARKGRCSHAGKLSGMKFFIPPEDVTVEPPKKAIFVTQIWRQRGNDNVQPLCGQQPQSSPPAFPEVTNFPWPVCKWWNDGRSGESRAIWEIRNRLSRKTNGMRALDDWAEQKHGAFTPFAAVLFNLFRCPRAWMSMCRRRSHTRKMSKQNCGDRIHS